MHSSLDSISLQTMLLGAPVGFRVFVSAITVEASDGEDCAGELAVASRAHSSEPPLPAPSIVQKFKFTPGSPTYFVSVNCLEQ